MVLPSNLSGVCAFRQIVSESLRQLIREAVHKRVAVMLAQACEPFLHDAADAADARPVADLEPSATKRFTMNLFLKKERISQPRTIRSCEIIISCASGASHGAGDGIDMAQAFREDGRVGSRADEAELGACDGLMISQGMGGAEAAR